MKKGLQSPVTDPETEDNSEGLEALLIFLQHHNGFDFTGYKRKSLSHRILKRMDDVGIETFESYLEYLKRNPGEFTPLFNTILINVTAFFRNEGAWRFLANQIIPRILDTQHDGEKIRVWSAGCASGEEVYTLAILFGEAIGVETFRQRLLIFATDVDRQALIEARQGRYRTKDMGPVSESLKAKYFQFKDGLFEFRRDLRSAFMFGRHDIIHDPPFGHLDLIACRNTLMYFNVETQREVMSRFYRGLNPGGYLFLGEAESVSAAESLFLPVSLQFHIWKKPEADGRSITRITGARTQGLKTDFAHGLA